MAVDFADTMFVCLDQSEETRFQASHEAPPLLGRPSRGGEPRHWLLRAGHALGVRRGSFLHLGLCY